MSIEPHTGRPPGIAGLIAMSVFISGAAMFFLPSPGRYVPIAAVVVLICFALVDAARRRRRKGG